MLGVDGAGVDSFLGGGCGARAGFFLVGADVAGCGLVGGALGPGGDCFAGGGGCRHRWDAVREIGFLYQ